MSRLLHARGSKWSYRQTEETLESALLRGRFQLPTNVTACLREAQVLVARHNAVNLQLEQLLSDSVHNGSSSDSLEE